MVRSRPLPGAGHHLLPARHAVPQASLAEPQGCAAGGSALTHTDPQPTSAGVLSLCAVWGCNAALFGVDPPHADQTRPLVSHPASTISSSYRPRCASRHLTLVGFHS